MTKYDITGTIIIDGLECLLLTDVKGLEEFAVLDPRELPEQYAIPVQQIYQHFETANVDVIHPRMLVDYCISNSIKIDYDVYNIICVKFLETKYYNQRDRLFTTRSMQTMLTNAGNNPDMFPDPEDFPTTTNLISVLFDDESPMSDTQ